MSSPTVHQDLVTLPAAEVMSHPVVAVMANTVLGDVLAAMLRTGLRHLVVLDRAGHCRGLVADRAVAAAWAADPSALACVTAGQLLDTRPTVVATDASVGDVARVLDDDRVDAAAVIDRGGRPVGVITSSDLIGVMARHTVELATSTLDPETDLD